MPASPPPAGSGTSFWSAANLGDPKRAYRWVVTITGFGADTATWHAKKVSKPSFAITETAHTFLNHKFYYPGRVEWNTVTVTLVDPVNPDAAANTTAIIAASGYAIPGSKDVRSTMGKANAVHALGSVQIEQLNTEGTAVETWILKNAWIKDVKYGDLDYEADDLTMIDLEIRYDWAELVTATPSDAGAALPNTNKFFSTSS